MFDHVKFGVTDYPASRAFYLAALEPLGIDQIVDYPPDGVEIVLTEPEPAYHGLKFQETFGDMAFTVHTHAVSSSRNLASREKESSVSSSKVSPVMM